MFGKLLAVLCNAFVLFALATTVAQAASWNTNGDNVVLDGYDVVAYRTEDRAIKGDRRYVARYDGVKFYFASKENRGSFHQERGRLRAEIQWLLRLCRWRERRQGAGQPQHLQVL